MNKTVLITGATSGIGLACARKFAENGDKLILTGRNEHRLAELKKELDTEVITLAFDVRDRDKAKKYLNELPEPWQDIDILVNNAGLALGLEPGMRKSRRLGDDDRHQHQGTADDDTADRTGHGQTEQWSYHQHRIGGW